MACAFDMRNSNLHNLHNLISKDIMKTLAKTMFVVAMGLSTALSTSGLWAAETAVPVPAPKKEKNWTAPSYKIYAQTLSEQIMKKHPELISVTFHGVPPGADKAYTMFAGSFPDRIGNPDDPDDIDVITKGITIVDPRWHRVNDPLKKFVMMLPLRDKANENVGLLVLAYKIPSNTNKTEMDFFKASSALRDGLRKQIPSYEALFEQAK
jgi:hypothetical protein